MKEFKITFDRKECIGAFTCGAVSVKFWELDDDGKANLKKSKMNEETGLYELIIPEEDYEEALESMNVCPIDIIKIEEVKNGIRINTITSH